MRESIRGEVGFDSGSRALYARDASNFRMVPIGVVFPKDEADVEAALRACREAGVPLLSRGGGTSLSGQCCNEAVVLDFSKYMNQVLDIDADRRVARVQPGAILDRLRKQARQYGLTFGPDPATHDHCTLGGMIGNNSCGVHAVMSEFYGPGPRVHDNLHSMEVLTYDGCRMRVGPTPEAELRRIIEGGGRKAQIYAALRELRDRYGDVIRERFPDIPRRVSGYNLPSLLPENGFDVARALAGSEGTCVTIVEASLELIPEFPCKTLLVLGYDDVCVAGDAVPEVRALAHKPIGCEGIDQNLVGFMLQQGMHTNYVQELPRGNAWLLIQFGGSTPQRAREKAEEALADLRRSSVDHRLFEDADEREELWQIRESGLGATAFVPGMSSAWPGWEDSAVPPEVMGPYLRELRALLRRYGYEASLYGHFAQGCVHTRIPFDLRTQGGLAEYRRFTREAAELVVRFGGSLSGEHGDGQQRGDLLPLMFGETLCQAFREFKAIFDPRWKMNPGKIVDALPRTENLTLQGDTPARTPETHFAFPHDGGSMQHAALRCVGIGDCRREDADGIMCPSYYVLRQEEHTTRGRAHLLYEMFRGEIIEGGWQSEEVKAALDLCLSCKGCTHECPVSVDVPTMKAEFLSHYYQRQRRPRAAYALGWIDRWARLGSLVPELANLVTQTKGIRALAKRAAGIHPSRTLPRFATETFRSWFLRDFRGPAGGPRVMLWPDTFNNHFHPQVLAAAVDALRDAGCQIVIPRRHLCCGRPLYDFGMLDRAKQLWRRVLDELEPEIAAGTPLIGIEPSCTAAFKEELTKLFPSDARAERLRELTHTLPSYLETLAGYDPPRLDGQRALVHFHCHHEAVMELSSERRLLHGMGLELERPQRTCCGMAGSFGFEDHKYQVSMAIGELGLLPSVRREPSTTLIIADGFSCRTQIADATQRRALHTAEVLQLARYRRQGRLAPELEIDAARAPLLERRNTLVVGRRLLGLGLLLCAAAGYGLWRRLGRA